MVKLKEDDNIDRYKARLVVKRVYIKVLFVLSNDFCNGSQDQYNMHSYIYSNKLRLALQ
jgi:hypothetical protein